MVAGKKLVCGCQGEEPAFDFKLGNCFDISVEGAIYHRSDLQLQLRRLSFGYKVFKKDFWGYFWDIFENIFEHCTYRTALCNIDIFILCRILVSIYRKAHISFSIPFIQSQIVKLMLAVVWNYTNIRSFYNITLSVKDPICCYKQSNWNRALGHQ